MDLPTHKGVPLESPYDQTSTISLNRHSAVEKLISWSGLNGVLSRDLAKFVIGENGQIRYVANRFIPANKHLLHVPFHYDISFATLKTEIHSDKSWIGWTDLKTRLKQFEEQFQWNKYNYEQKDYFSKNVLLAVAIIGVLYKLKKINNNTNTTSGHTNLGNTNPTQEGGGGTSTGEPLTKSFLLETFEHYWKAIRVDVGNVIYNWTSAELLCLQGSSLSNCLCDARRFGEELYYHVILPFITLYPNYFGGIHSNDIITLNDYFHINSIILTQSFGTGKKEKPTLLPIIDLVNGKPNDLHNVTLENCAIQKEINGEFIKFHVLETYCDIYAGDEIFLEYAQVGNGDYLMTYNHIPLDPEMIMNNQKTDIFLDLSEFFEDELLRRHPNSSNIRLLKKKHIYGFFNLPKTMPITMEDLFSPQYSCIPSLRQVLIFLQFDENDAKRSITTGRIKSQLSPHQVHDLFRLFVKFIEITLTKPNLLLFRALLDNKLPASMIQSLATINTSTTSTASPPITTLAGTTSTSLTSPSSSSSSSTLSTTTNNNDAIPTILTENMKSAIYLQISERLVVEVMINRFISLFPDRIHEFAYSIVRDHLISSEVNAILDELCQPMILARQSLCLVCGSKQNLSKCSRCRKAYYCSAACQKEHWPYHKNVCRPSTSTGNSNTNVNTSPSTSKESRKTVATSSK